MLDASLKSAIRLGRDTSTRPRATSSGEETTSSRPGRPEIPGTPTQAAASTTQRHLHNDKSATPLRLGHCSPTGLLRLVYSSTQYKIRHSFSTTSPHGSSTALLVYGSTGGGSTGGAGKTKGFLSPQESGHRTMAFSYRHGNIDVSAVHRTLNVPSTGR
jgi:hypothetical protein